MRVLYSLMGLLALACGASAQNVFPLSALTVQATGSLDVAGNPVTLSANMPVTPSVSAYNQKSLRYATEYTSQAPISVRISWSATDLYGTATSIKFRNCASSLVNPTAVNTFSYCSYAAATTVTNGAANTIDVQNLWGTAYLEFQTTATINGVQAIPISYILTVGVFSGAGTNMLSLDTDYGTSNFNFPYTGQRSQYTIGYSIQVQSGSSFGVFFYFATQSTVNTVFVQECPGISCLTCDINALADRKVIAGTVPFLTGTTPFNVIDQTQLDLPNGNFAANGNTKHGRYTFPAVPGSNCLRFINRIDAGVDGTNEYTITIGLTFFNCGSFLTCSACVPTTGCGWCLQDNFVQNTGFGFCRVANADYSSALTGGACTAQTGLIVPRFIAGSPSLCTVIIKGDPRISGLQGQDFQVHGTPNEYFNLVSTPALQVNSRFVYLDEAACDNFTACFSHPGTYIDEIGVMMADQKVRLVAGSIKEAARVFINGKEVTVSAHKHSAGKITVTFANTRRVVVKTPEFMMTVSQSDKFFNVESALLKTELLDQGSKLVKLESSRATESNAVMHGLIGQTWRNNVYAGNREYEGEVSDYQVADGIWGKDFAFNLYQN